MSSIETKTNSHVDLDIGYTKKIIFDSHKDLIINLYGNNILNNTVRNHSSFVKDNVPMPGANFGIDVSLPKNCILVPLESAFWSLANPSIWLLIIVEFD